MRSAPASDTTPRFLRAGGEMGALMRAHDWSATPLGPVDHWPAALRFSVRLMLDSRHPMLVFWGPSSICLYNDAHRAAMGPQEHPSSLGQPAPLACTSVWPVIGPDVAHVLRGDGALWCEQRVLPSTRPDAAGGLWWSSSYTPIDDPAAESGVGGVLVACQEVTHYRRLRESIAREREQLFDVLRQAPGFIAALRGPEHVFELANDAFLRLVGGQRRVLGRPVREALPELAGQQMFERLDAVLASGEPFSARGATLLLDHGARQPAQRQVDWVLQPARTAGGAVSGVIIEGSDVTDLHESERHLRAEREATQAIFAYSRDIICTMQRDGRLGRISASVRSVLGYEPAELFGRVYLELVHPEDVARTRAMAQALLTGHQVSAFENRFLRKDGSVVHLAWSLVWVAEQDRAYAIGRDLSDRVHHEAAVRNAQKREAVGRLAGGLAHDFNNLLTIVVGNADALSEELAHRPDLRQLADMTRDAAERGAELTRRLLALSRQQVLAPRTVDVNALVHGMVELLRRSLGEAVEMQVRTAADLWHAYIDSSQLESAILNLCVNARDAMPQGGHLVIETRKICIEELFQDSGFVRNTDDLTPGEYVRISVQDTGCGMAPEVMERAFDPFFSTKESDKGTGLGLAMVHGFARQSGGTATVCSAIGAGTTVSIYLPRSDRVVDDVACELETRPGPHVEARILLVEDDAMVRDYATRVLRGLGYPLLVACDAAEALVHLGSDAPIDLLFTDVVMPGGMGGPELAEYAARLRPGLAVLYTSGYTDNQLLQRDGEKAVLLLRKPYRRQALAAMVQQALSASACVDNGHG